MAEKSKQKIGAEIERHGWVVVAAKADDDAPARATSIGLYRKFNHPEIVVVGLPPETANKVIDAVAESVSEGKSFEANTIHADILARHDVAFVAVSREFFEDYVRPAVGFYGNDEFPALQLVWPDRAGKFPWDDEIDAQVAAMQPVLVEQSN
ncbi:MAG: hypothetical protein JWN02_617 [Acidobacteria bacterium]|nr:hypothetical protein [Acidobacteriota bacterium]